MQAKLKKKTFEKLSLEFFYSGLDCNSSAPAFYYTRPLNAGPMHPLAVTKSNSTPLSVVKDPNVRTSRRLQGAGAVDIPPLEEVEKNARMCRTLLRGPNSPEKQDLNNSSPQDQIKKTSQDTPSSSGVRNSQGSQSSSGSKTNTSSTQKLATSSGTKKPVKKDIWGSKGYRSRRRRKRKRLDMDTEDFAELDSDNEEGGESENEEEEDMEADTVDETKEQQAGNKSENCESDLKASENIDNCVKKSQHDTSQMEHLSVDVHMKSPKETICKSPSQRSPRSSSQKSPRQQNDESTPVRAQSDSGHMTRSQRLSVEGRSPRSGDKTSVNSGLSQRSPRSVPKLDESVDKNCADPKESESANPSSGSKYDSQTPEKPPILKALLNGFVDSGVGSSDSSGDSNDSVGKLIQEQAKETKTAIHATEVSSFLIILF